MEEDTGKNWANIVDSMYKIHFIVDLCLFIYTDLTIIWIIIQ